MPLTAEQLLAGSQATHEVEVPPGLLPIPGDGDTLVVLRPLTVLDLQRIGRAAREDEGMSAALMIQQALVEPALKASDVSRLPAGLARFLVERIDEISGIGTPRGALEEMVQAQLARACFVLAKEFGWTAQEASGMTVGQILLYLQMLHDAGESP